LSITNPTEDFVHSDSKALRFYMVTPAGVRSVSFPMADTEKKDSAARALYAYGQQVVTELRQIPSIQK
jgi:4-hydroxyphenylpyruvate dioxygenase-like putative hemolysin